MLFALSLLAALACALFYGVTAVLQKIGSNTQKTATSLNPLLFVRLLGNAPYLIGIILDLSAWPLTIFAAHNLPLFVVQPIISLSVAVTVAVEWLFLHRPIRPVTLVAIASVIVGLIVIATQAGVETSRPLSKQVFFAVTIIGPLVIIALGAACARLNNRFSNICLAVLAGSSFGLAAVAARVLVIQHPLWHNLYQPALIAQAAYGAIAILLFTTALQRSAASIVNAAVVGIETLLPTILGIWLLGDTTRNGSFVLMALAATLMVGGTIALVFTQPAQSPKCAVS